MILFDTGLHDCGESKTKLNPVTAICKIPSTCLIRFKSLDLKPSEQLLQRLVQHCRDLEFDFLSYPSAFDPAWTVQVDAMEDVELLQCKLASWAMSRNPSLDWVSAPHSGPSQAESAADEQHCALESHGDASFEWREAQMQLRDKLASLKPRHIGILEGSTGLGKTRVMCQWVLEHLRQHSSPVLIAVPTVIIAQQWIAELAEIDPNVPVQPVLGLAHYEKPKDQAIALHSAKDARLVICTQHMLLQLLPLQRWTLVVDEAHMLYFAIAATAGRFLPISAMGERFEAWCVDHLGLQEGVAQEVELSGSMRKAVLGRFGSKASHQAQAFAVVQSEGGMGVAVREPGAASGALDSIWHAVDEAVLLSATQSMRSSAGVRSVRVQAQRLRIPDARVQDLGQVRAAWRDSGVVVKVPQKSVGTDGRVWLSPHASRKQIWFEEVAQIVKRWSSQPCKTLLLATSYSDVQGVFEACKAASVGGVIASTRQAPMRELQMAFETPQVWCWIATGAAWTGMDLKMPLSRLAICKLPLQVPEDEAQISSLQQLQFDCVSRFKQGAGRLVRWQSEMPRQLVVLDGRINESSPWWRSVCQPYLQVLAEDYEDHGIIEAHCP